MKTMKSLVTTTLAILFASPAYAGPWGKGYWDWGWPLGGCSFFGWWPMGWAGLLLRLAFWAILIAGAVFLIKRLVRSGKRTGFREATVRAYDSLATRYARGEVTREEFEQMRRDLL